MKHCELSCWFHKLTVFGTQIVVNQELWHRSLEANKSLLIETATKVRFAPPPCVSRWWVSWVTPAASPHSLSTTSPSRRSTAPWTRPRPTASQPAAASVQPSPPSKRWTASRRPNPTAPPHTAPPATAWTPPWLQPDTSTASTARVSPDTSPWAC